MKSFQKILLFICLIAVCLGFNLVFAEDIYYPYPIIFVHGINSDTTTWNTTRDNLEKFFYDEIKGFKYYQTSRWDYFPICDYRNQNNGDIPTIANSALRGVVDRALEKLPTDQRKVIIVCYSMGGLVLRSLLAQDASGYYKSKIDKVIFLGTPNNGAPGPSALWILKEVKDKVLEPMIKDYSSFYSQKVGSIFRFSDNSYQIIASAPVNIYDDMASQLKSLNGFWGKVIGSKTERVLADVIPDPRGKAIEQLRLSQNVLFTKIITAEKEGKEQSISIGALINGSQTFLGQADQNLKLPDKYKVILFHNNILGIPKAWALDKLVSMQGNFSFPSGESLDDVINNGDGIVSFESQGSIGNVIEPAVNGFHTDEPKNWQAILDAIDDPPVIEKVRAIREYESTSSYNKKHFIIIKVKDYLLADIEIDALTLDGADIRPADFKEAEDKPYKPYTKFAKNFLKKRIGGTSDDPNFAPKDIWYHILPESDRTLEPGEFYVKVNEITEGNHSLYMRFKNPAGKTVELAGYISKPWVSNVWFDSWGIDPPPYFIVNYPEPPHSLFPHQTNLTFDIHNPSTPNIKLDLWIVKAYPAVELQRHFETDRPVTLGGSPGNYMASWGPVMWDGSADSGGYLSEVTCKVFIRVKPLTGKNVIYPTDIDKTIYLASNNWEKFDSHDRDTIWVDPTFIVHSRKTNNMKIDLIEKKSANTQNASNELLAQLKEINADSDVIAKVEAGSLQKKSILDNLKECLPFNISE